MIKRFISYYKPHRKLFTLDMIAAFFIAIADLFYPIISRNLLNIYIPNKQINFVVFYSLVLLGIYFVKMLLSYFVQYYGHLVGVYMQAHMRKDVFLHLQKLPFSYYDENQSGAIMSRMVNDLMDVSELAHHGPEDLFISLVLIVSAFIYLCTIHVGLTVLIFACIPILIWFCILMRKRMNVAFRESREKIADVNANLENSISGIRVARAFTSTDHELEKFQVGNKAFVGARKKAYRAMGQFFAGTGFITDALNVIVLLAGGIATYQGVIEVGDFVAYMLFINMFINPIKKLINFMEQYQEGMSGFKRFTQLIDEEVEVENENARDIDDVKGAISFEHVNFQYGNGREVLTNIEMKINPGEKIALVGESGGGKTTICHLIPQFYALDSGQILIDGINIKDFTYQSLRKNIGIVQQDVFLFTGTIKDNIAYGCNDASDEEVIDAAKKANIHDHIMSLPDGYLSQVGQRGVKLSGGQKQRISIARVFLKNPSILILDEATSALDTASEAYIQASLDELCKGRTTIVVAHRLSTIQQADKIFVIEEGQIKEEGTHAELLKQNGIYKNLYSVQFNH